jgi:cell division protein FtsB
MLEAAQQRLTSVRTWLIVSLVSLQLPLWFGDGGWLEVWRIERQVQNLASELVHKEHRIAELQAELKDLRHGFVTAEERARFELGLLKPGETFLQYHPER